MNELNPVHLEMFRYTKLVEPLCPYFGTCGGCAYQHLPYEEELALKENQLKNLLKELELPNEIFSPIAPSPEPYFYRSRLDLSFRRTRQGFILGFMSEGTRRHISIDSCSIAKPEISNFLPRLRELASEKIPSQYRSANLVVKTGDEGVVRWGGMGRRSLRMNESEYFWTEIEGKKIFYSLDSFFQANLSILPLLIKDLRELLSLTPETYLLDLYAGVGLFWAVLASETRGVWAVEENRASVRVAEFNRRYHGLSQVVLKEARTEDCLEEILQELEGRPIAAIVDPPRKGLTADALSKLSAAKMLNPLLYISCNAEALVRDLEGFLRAGWRVDRVVPYDFFPRTKHLETVARLLPPERNISKCTGFKVD